MEIVASFDRENRFCHTIVVTKFSRPNTSSIITLRYACSLSSQCTQTDPSGGSNVFTSTSRSRIMVNQTVCSSASSYWRNDCCVLNGGSEIHELDLADVLPREFRQLDETGKRVEGAATDQQVIVRPVPVASDRASVVE
jgi:hypothetical protein